MAGDLITLLTAFFRGEELTAAFLLKTLLVFLVAAFGFLLMQKGFELYLSYFPSITLVYGAFATVPIFLLWIFLSWNIVLLGVEISYALTAFNADTHRQRKRHPVIMLLDLLELFYKKQQVGQSVTEAEALDVLGREEIGRWPSYVLMLEKQNLLMRTDDNNYVLVRSLAQVDFWSFYSQLPYPLPHRKDLGHVFSNDQWMEKIGPALIESDDYLAAKLAIPLSAIFEKK